MLRELLEHRVEEKARELYCGELHTWHPTTGLSLSSSSLQRTKGAVPSAGKSTTANADREVRVQLKSTMGTPDVIFLQGWREEVGRASSAEVTNGHILAEPKSSKPLTDNGHYSQQLYLWKTE